MKRLSRNLLIALPCAIILVAAVVVLCVLFIPKGNKNMALDVSEVVVTRGESKEIEIFCSNPNATFSFEMQDDEIASVEDGVVFGKKIGTTKMNVTARFEDDYAKSVVIVKVVENFNEPLVDLPSEVELFLLDKNVEDANKDGFYNRKMFSSFRPHTVSGEEGVVKVENGTITALKLGSANLIFSSTTTLQTYSVKVTVSPILPKEIICEKQIEMFAKETKEIEYTLSPSYYTGEVSVTFASDSEIVSFEDNVMTAKHSGTCVVVVDADGVQASIDVTIKILFEYSVEPSGVDANCKYEGGVLKVLRGETARFTISVTGINYTLNADEWDIRSDDLALPRDAGHISLVTETDGTIEIYSDTLVSSVIIRVVVVDSL